MQSVEAKLTRNLDRLHSLTFCIDFIIFLAWSCLYPIYSLNVVKHLKKNGKEENNLSARDAIGFI